MASITYTSFYQVNQDLALYISLKNGESLHLAHIPTIASNRWSWLVSKWSTIKQDFKEFANGEQYLEDNLVDLDRSVQSALIGNDINVLAIPEKFVKYSEFLATITLASITLSKRERDIVNTEVARINNLNITQFREMLAFLKQQSVLTAQYVGLADETSAKMRNTTVVPKKRSANYTDMLVLNAGIDLEKFIEGIVIQLKNTSKKPPNLLQVANSNLDPLTPFQVNTAYRSYSSVPFSGSLQSMAKQYLGSVDAWYELVTVNNLKPPFVDDVGTKISFLSSGSGNTIYIPNTQKESVSISSKIKIGSFRLKEELRVVERVTDNKDGTLTVFLSGEKDLSKLTVADKAYARVFKPGTVTTGSFILIPKEITSSLQNKPTPSSDELRRLDAQLLAFGVDIQRDETTNDIIIDPSGNFKMSYGVANIRQTVMTVLRIEQGELPYQPGIGLPAFIGDQYFGSFSEAQAISDLVKKAVLRDPRFSEAFVLGLQNGGNNFSFNLLAYIQNLDTPIPLSFIG